MSALQELQLLEIMCSCFLEQSRDAVRQLIFSALFGLQGNQADDSRMALLCKLVSMAIAVGRVSILECAATWLQRSHRGCCVRLARVLVDDYCSLVPGSVPTLRNIHRSSPRFCCQFITAVTTLYDLSSGELCPPVDLVSMVMSWLQEDPSLILITFLNTPVSASQPISSLDLTPLAGLVRWCVKAPLAYRREGKPSLTNGTTDVGALFSALHLSVLQVLLLLPAVLTDKGILGRLALLQLDQLSLLTSDLARLLENTHSHTHADTLSDIHADALGDTHAQLCVDRLAQALQVSMATGALLCSREELRVLCSRLPHSNLLQLVMCGPVQPSGFYPHIHTPPLGYSSLASPLPPPLASPLTPHPSHTPLASPLTSHPSHPSFSPQPFLPAMSYSFHPTH